MLTSRSASALLDDTLAALPDPSDEAMAQVLARSLGLESSFVAEYLIDHATRPLTGAVGGGNARSLAIDLLLDLAPQGPIETMLAVQLAATHAALVAVVSRAGDEYDPAFAESAEKLGRLFCEQAQSFRKLKGSLSPDNSANHELKGLQL